MLPEPAQRTQRRWLLLAGGLHVAAMLLVMLGLVRLTPLTMSASVGAAGTLLAAACAIYLLGVVIGLRRRRIL
jgi:drug/metabolite transporter (DMT)-like permease